MYQVIAQDKNITLYRKELNEITGGVLESIFLSQLLYWHEKSGGEFYKFVTPCEHKLYTQGDSWAEELGFGRKVILRILKDFKEKDFISTKTTMDRLTFYTVNITKIDGLLKGIYESPKKGFTKVPKRDLRKSQKGIYESPKRGFMKVPKRDLHYSKIIIKPETTTETTTDTKGARENSHASVFLFELPEWINKEIWQDFEEMRKKIKKPLTLKAKQLIIKKLEELGKDSANKILEQSILNAWQDVYPLKNNTQQKTSASGVTYGGVVIAGQDAEAFARMHDLAPDVAEAVLKNRCSLIDGKNEMVRRRVVADFEAEEKLEGAYE